MRKLLHLVFAVWKTNRPFDKNHYPWEDPTKAQPAKTTPTAADLSAMRAADKEAVGPQRGLPAKEVVTTADSTLALMPLHVKATARPSSQPRPKVDYTFLRKRITMDRVLGHLGLLSQLRGHGQQRRGPCPLHSEPGATHRSFSVHLGKNAFQCFHADCGLKGNVLDLWAAIHRLPLYDAALHLAETFGLPRNREEKPVARTRSPEAATVRFAAVASAVSGQLR
jgi:hypothetical protein